MNAQQVQERYDELHYLTEDLSDNPKDYSEWEANFILSVESQKERGRALSEKQLLKVKEIYDKHNVAAEDDDEEQRDLLSDLPPTYSDPR